MKKSALLFCLCIFCFCASRAQLKNADAVQKELNTENKDTIAWSYGGVFDLGINQGFMHNISAGGEIASLTVNSIFSGHLNRLHGREIWSNNLNMIYGLYYAYSNDFVPHKTDDRIDFTSKYGYRIDTVKNYYITGLFNFQSQFTKGYDYSNPNWENAPSSNFLSPGYFTLAAGGEYRAGSDVSFFLSPVAGRVTVASKYYTSQSAQGAFGIDSNKTVLYQFGAYFSGRYTWNINKKMVFKTRLDMYSNYLAKDTKDSAGNIIKHDNPSNISFLFDNLFSYKMSKSFNMTLGATFIYDNNIPYIKTYVNQAGMEVLKNNPEDWLGWLQVRELFTLGIEYKF